MRFTRRALAWAFVLAALDASLTGLVGAQTLRGVVTDSASRQPIAGAVVQLLDSSHAVLRRFITNELGRYGFALVSGARWVRVIRIGFQPRDVRLPSAAGDMTVDVQMTPVATMLAEIRVQEASSCPRRSDDAITLGLWEQARAGLLATVVAREANPADMQRLVFERRFDGYTNRITRFSVDGQSSGVVDRAFNASFSAEAFVKSGFAADSAGVQILYGPDAEVLLDDAFTRAYCFRRAPNERNRPTEVGLAFAPAHRNPERVDIEGTLWVDTASRALTGIEFRYVGLPPVTSPFEPGGRISFRQMPNGVVLVDRWQLRGVVGDYPQTASAATIVYRAGMSAIEFGGELASATWPDGRSWHARLGSLRVHALNSDGTPAVHAIVSLRDTYYRGTSDANGDVMIEDLVPGLYWLQIVDPRVAELGIAMETPVSFTAARDSTARVVVRIPTAEEYVTHRCVEAHQRSSGPSMLVLGRVVTGSDVPVSGARVEYAIERGPAEWRTLNEHFETGADGTFQECTEALNLGSVIRIRVRRPDMADADTALTLAGRLTVVRVRVPAPPAPRRDP